MGQIIKRRFRVPGNDESYVSAMDIMSSSCHSSVYCSLLDQAYAWEGCHASSDYVPFLDFTGYSKCSNYS